MGEAFALAESGVNCSPDFYDFIVTTVESKKGRQLSDPVAYVNKCLQNGGNQWRSRYAESQRQIIEPQNFVLQDWQIEQTIKEAMKRQDYEFAIARFNKYPEVGSRVLEDYPEWAEKLTGLKQEISIDPSRKFLTKKLGILKVKKELRLNTEQKLETEREIKSVEELLER